MKKQACTILATLTLFVLLTATPVFAQFDLSLRVNIPFEFSVGENTLPAGKYTVRYLNQTCLVIRSEDCTVSLIFSSMCARDVKVRSESSLVFNRYGDEYFLASVWTAGSDTGNDLFKSPAERELIRSASASAKIAWERQLVSIVAHR